MQSRKIINRRAFCAGILAASAVQASDPIVDLKKKSSPLTIAAEKADNFSTTRERIHRFGTSSAWAF